MFHPQHLSIHFFKETSKNVRRPLERLVMAMVDKANQNGMRRIQPPQVILMPQAKMLKRR